MIRTSGWVNALFALVFIAVPALVGYYFLLPDWNNNHYSLWVYWVVSLCFLAYVSLLSFILIRFEFLGWDSLTFNIPITFVFIMILISYEWHMALRVIGAFAGILTAVPANIIVANIVNNKARRSKIKYNSKKQK